MSKKETIIMALSVIVIITGSFVLGVQISPIYEEYSQSRSISSQVESSECYNDSLSITAECLRKQMIDFYKYNISNIDLYRSGKSIWQEEINWETIKRDGGVCWHFARWYYDRAKELGIYTTLPFIRFNESESHMNAIISDQDEYCVMEQIQTPKCFKFINGGQNE